MSPDPAHARFWKWFQENGDRLRTMMYGDDDAEREAASEELREAVAEVAPDLILELGRFSEEGVCDLVVSADGRRERVDAVKDFVAAAPPLRGWNVVAFRSRIPDMSSLAIRLEDESVSPDDIWFRVTEDDDGLDLTLFVRDLTPENERLRGLGAMLLAEHAVGERDCLTLLTGLHAEPLPDDPDAAGLQSFRELTEVFDESKVRKYPPPGSIPLDPEGQWQAMEGTIQGEFAVVLLNTGLRLWAGHPNYDQQLVVTIPFNRMRKDGMPATEEEYLAVQDLGVRVGDALEEGQQSLLAINMMTRGRRELVFYTSDVEGALRRLNELRGEVETHRLESKVERDTFWGLYRAFYEVPEGDEDAPPEEEGDE